MILIAATLLLQCSDGASPIKPIQEPRIMSRIHGGLFDGLSIGQIDLNKDDYYQGMLPSEPGVSPIPAEDKAAVDAFIAGHVNATAAPLRRYVVLPEEMINCLHMGGSCDTVPVSSVTFIEDVEPNVPFYLGQDNVRVEWMYGRALYYISYLKLVDGKIVSIKNTPAIPPQVTRREGSSDD